MDKPAAGVQNTNFLKQFQAELSGGYHHFQPHHARSASSHANKGLAAIEKHLANPKNGFKMYGASWCGACKNFLASLGISIETIEKGGKQKIVWKIGDKTVGKPAWYVGCDEDENVCAKITAYPTLEINGELQTPGGMGQEQLIQKLLACTQK